jgi:hypothetical protein
VYLADIQSVVKEPVDSCGIRDDLLAVIVYGGRLKSSWTDGSAPLLCQVVVVGVT